MSKLSRRGRCRRVHRIIPCFEIGSRDPDIVFGQPSVAIERTRDVLAPLPTLESGLELEPCGSHHLKVPALP